MLHNFIISCILHLCMHWHNDGSITEFHIKKAACIGTLSCCHYMINVMGEDNILNNVN